MNNRIMFTLVAIMVTVAVLVTGTTMSAYSDTETSTSNLFTGFTSQARTWTSQSDFESGITSSVDTTSSPGNVRLDMIGSAKMILFWDQSGALPAGWTDISSNSAAPFYQKFPRGGATYGTTGGADTHTHTSNVAVTAIGAAGGTATLLAAQGSTQFLPATHSHAVAGSTAAAAAGSNLPAYWDFRVIRWDGGGAPTTIPAGAIAIFDNDTNLNSLTGWAPYSATDTSFIRGNSSANTTGGSNTHTHVVSVNLTSTGTSTVGAATGTATVSYATHSHTVSGSNSDSQSSLPPYITVKLGKATSNVAAPLNMIAMFDSTPDGRWEVVSDGTGTNQDFNGTFIKAGAAYDASTKTLNNSAHTHTATLNTNTISGSAQSQAKKSGTTIGISDAVHTHPVDVSIPAITTGTTLPPYVTVIFAKLISYSVSIANTGTVTSTVYSNYTSSARWDALAWDCTIPTNTGITFEVRSSPNSFLATADNATVPWSSYGSTNVTSGLPSGYYIQWRATLTRTVNTITPTLNEVRLYYSGY